MFFFHTTDAASAIQREGFRDAEGTYLTANTYRCVWFANTPATASDGPEGETVIVVEMPEDAALLYEWVEDGRTFREFLIPAGIANRYPIRGVYDLYEVPNEYLPA